MLFQGDLTWLGSPLRSLPSRQEYVYSPTRAVDYNGHLRLFVSTHSRIKREITLTATLACLQCTCGIRQLQVSCPSPLLDVSWHLHLLADPLADDRLHDAILTRLSNDDDPERNLSTFANEMASSATILSMYGLALGVVVIYLNGNTTTRCG